MKIKLKLRKLYQNRLFHIDFMRVRKSFYLDIILLTYPRRSIFQYHLWLRVSKGGLWWAIKLVVYHRAFRFDGRIESEL